MSTVKIQGNAAGTGALTIAAPNTNTDRTLTLPDAAGTISTEAYAANASNLATGTVPVARLATSGTPSADTYLRGDNTWATPTAPILLATLNITTSLTALDVVNLGSWDVINLSFINVVGSIDNELRVSSDNGSTFLTSGYASRVNDTVANTDSTAGIRFTRGESGVFRGNMLLSNLSAQAVASSNICMTTRVSYCAGIAPAAVVNAIRITLSTYTSGTLKVFGLVPR